MAGAPPAVAPKLLTKEPDSGERQTSVHPLPTNSSSGGSRRTFRDHLNRRLLVGIIVVVPFGLTIWLLFKFVALVAGLLTKPALNMLDWLDRIPWMGWLTDALKPDDQMLTWAQYQATAVALLLTLVGLYLMGLLSATFFGRRWIAAGERMLRRIPGAEFVYSTIKQVIEIISNPRSEAFQKVVMIEYPRKGIRGLAFFSGVTLVPSTDETMVNVFIPTTPNPTSGFLLLMRPDEVWDTNLTVAAATRFIISGGVVAMANLELRPFPIDEYETEIEALRQTAAQLRSEWEERAQGKGEGLPAPAAQVVAPAAQVVDAEARKAERTPE